MLGTLFSMPVLEVSRDEMVGLLAERGSTADPDTTILFVDEKWNPRATHEGFLAALESVREVPWKAAADREEFVRLAARGRGLLSVVSA